MKVLFFCYALALSSLISFSQERGHYNSKLSIEKQDSLVSNSNLDKLPKWQYGMGLTLGYGMLTNELRSNFKNFIVYDLSFYVEYKNTLALGIGIDYGASKTKEDIPLGETNSNEELVWLRDRKANFSNLKLYLRGNLLESSDIKIMPFVGISSMGIAAEKGPYWGYYPEAAIEEYWYRDKLRFDKSAMLLGMILDFKVRKSKFESHEYIAIRVKYTYNTPNFDKKYGMLSGNLQTLTIGIGGLFGSKKLAK